MIFPANFHMKILIWNGNCFIFVFKFPFILIVQPTQSLNIQQFMYPYFVIKSLGCRKHSLVNHFLLNFQIDWKRTKCTYNTIYRTILCGNAGGIEVNTTEICQITTSSSGGDKRMQQYQISDWTGQALNMQRRLLSKLYVLISFSRNNYEN